ncbi:hypothetical protein LCGC14_3136210, partial [marine sediment metagenome]
TTKVKILTRMEKPVMGVFLVDKDQKPVAGVPFFESWIPSPGGNLVIVYKPFQQGDHISVKSLEGRVVDINLRYTTLTADGKTIFIPNAMVFSNAVTVGGA